MVHGSPDASAPALAPRRDLAGLGLSDASCYATPLARVFDYENTWFHTEPRVDITRIDPARRGRYDFVVASDVFEHVAPPVARAFDNALAAAQAGSVFVLTVQPAHREEHDEGSSPTAPPIGRTQTYGDLVFHGGPGTTLEMRLFSRERSCASSDGRASRACASPTNRTCLSAFTGPSRGRCPSAPSR